MDALMFFSLRVRFCWKVPYKWRCTAWKIIETYCILMRKSMAVAWTKCQEHSLLKCPRHHCLSLPISVYVNIFPNNVRLSQVSYIPTYSKHGLFFLVWTRNTFLIPNWENSCNRGFLFFLGFAVHGGSMSRHLKAFAHRGPCAPLHLSFLQQMCVQQIGQSLHSSFERYLAWQRFWILRQLEGRIRLWVTWAPWRVVSINKWRMAF